MYTRYKNIVSFLCDLRLENNLLANLTSALTKTPDEINFFIEKPSLCTFSQNVRRTAYRVDEKSNINCSIQKILYIKTFSVKQSLKKNNSSNN